MFSRWGRGYSKYFSKTNGLELHVSLSCTSSRCSQLLPVRRNTGFVGDGLVSFLLVVSNPLLVCDHD